MSSRIRFFAHRSFSVFLPLLGGALSALSASASDWQEREVLMYGALNYMQEVCIAFQKDDRVSYRMESAHEVYFDVHYHPEAGTQFKERLEAVTATEGQFISEAAQSYCFTWKNKAGIETDWTANLFYRVARQ